MIANIQLEWLMTNGEVLSDEQAKIIKNEQYANTDSDAYLQDLVKM